MGNIPIEIFSQFDALKAFGINSKIRLAHFLSQASHESGNFLFTTENLNYSATALVGTFPKYFTSETALSYARQPEKIANHVYANRMGNGDENSGDGWKFRGRGFIQLTGFNNYNAFDATVHDDVIKHPELVATKYALISGAWFFQVNKINQVSDLGASVAVVEAVTKRVNGGLNGLHERIQLFQKIYAELK